MSDTASCPFCGLESEDLLSGNELAVSFLDRFPVTQGHTLVIPRRHVADVFDLSPNEMEAISTLVRERARELQAKDASVTGFNVGVNVGAAAGQTVFHCHVHLIPRRVGDMEDPTGGVRHVIPEKGNYLAG